MLTLKVVCPQEQTADLLSRLDSDSAVLNLMVHTAKSHRPQGEMIEFDIVPEAGNRIIAMLRSMDIDKTGSISLMRVDAVFSEMARTTEEHTPGIASESVMWEEIEVRTRAEAALTPTFVLLTVTASLIAAIGLFTDSVILLVGAMVVGPEYGSIAHISIVIQRRTPYRIIEGARTLAIGFGAAIAATALMSIVLNLADAIPDAYLDGSNPMTAFVARPDRFTVLIALLAGVAGTLSLTQVKSGTLVGVLVSVTTITAVVNMGVAIALGRGHYFVGAFFQLAANVAALVLAGSTLMAFQRRILARTNHDPKVELGQKTTK